MTDALTNNEEGFRQLVVLLRRMAKNPKSFDPSIRGNVLQYAADVVEAAYPQIIDTSWAIWSISQPKQSDFATVYLHFDSVGRLLYVGETTRGFARQLEHARGKPWYQEIKQTRLVHVANKPQARSVEAFFIQTLEPEMNIAMNAGATKLERSDIEAAMAERVEYPEQSARTLRLANRRGLLLASEARALSKLEEQLASSKEAA